MDEILQAISTVGFPIVAYGGMFYLMNIRMTELRDAVNELKEVIKAHEDINE